MKLTYHEHVLTLLHHCAHSWQPNEEGYAVLIISQIVHQDESNSEKLKGEVQPLSDDQIRQRHQEDSCHPSAQ